MAKADMLALDPVRFRQARRALERQLGYPEGVLEPDYVPPEGTKRLRDTVLGQLLPVVEG